MKWITTLALLITLAMHADDGAGPSASRVELEKARGIYQGMLKKNMQTFVRKGDILKEKAAKTLAAKIARAKASGDLDTVLQLQKEVEKIELDKVKDKHVASLFKRICDEKDKGDALAKEKYKAYLKKMVARYTKADKIAVAKMFQDELKGLDKPPPEGSTPFAGSYYRVFNQKMTWDEAKKFCQQKGGALAVIETAKENAFVSRLVSKNIGKGATWIHWPYIGCSKVRGSWVWVDGSKMNLAFWLPGQPDNPDKEFCLQISPAGKWNDALPAHRSGFVCEWAR